MLRILLYHRVGEGKYANTPEMLYQHLSYLKKNYQTILPGNSSTGVCLTFDDATFDFYDQVYPLLKKLDLRAVLGVVAKLVPEETLLTSQERLLMKTTFDGPSEAFCSRAEIKEMVNSGHVECACHSMTHADLSHEGISLEDEIITSKQILEKHLEKEITTFIFPFGRFSKDAKRIANRHYKYVMRIGNAVNFSWKQKMLYRINADCLKDAKPPFTFSQILRYFFNTLRLR